MCFVGYVLCSLLWGYFCIFCSVFFCVFFDIGGGGLVWSRVSEGCMVARKKHDFVFSTASTPTFKRDRWLFLLFLYSKAFRVFSWGWKYVFWGGLGLACGVPVLAAVR